MAKTRNNADDEQKPGFAGPVRLYSDFHGMRR